MCSGCCRRQISATTCRSSLSLITLDRLELHIWSVHGPFFLWVALMFHRCGTRLNIQQQTAARRGTSCPCPFLRCRSQGSCCAAKFSPRSISTALLQRVASAQPLLVMDSAHFCDLDRPVIILGSFHIPLIPQDALATSSCHVCLRH